MSKKHSLVSIKIKTDAVEVELTPGQARELLALLESVFQNDVGWVTTATYSDPSQITYTAAYR